MKREAAILLGSSLLAMLTLPAALFATDLARTVRYAQTDIIPIHAKVRFSTLIVLPATRRSWTSPPAIETF